MSTTEIVLTEKEIIFLTRVLLVYYHDKEIRDALRILVAKLPMRQEESPADENKDDKSD